jgi:hypothetical protein
MADQDHDRLIEALQRCGLEEVGRRTGAYVRMLWPDEQRSLLIPLNPDAPDYPDIMNAIRRELAIHVRRGRTASAVASVLDDFMPEGHFHGYNGFHSHHQPPHGDGKPCEWGMHHDGPCQPLLG